MPENKVYLGDGAYAEYDGYHIVVTAENGIIATDTVALEDKVFHSLLLFAMRYEPFASYVRKVAEKEE